MHYRDSAKSPFHGPEFLKRAFFKSLVVSMCIFAGAANREKYFQNIAGRLSPWTSVLFGFFFLLVHLFIKNPRNSWMVDICAADFATAQPACNKSHNNWVQLNSETGLEAAGIWMLPCFSLVAVCSVAYWSVTYLALFIWIVFIFSRICVYHNLCVSSGNPWFINLVS